MLNKECLYFKYCANSQNMGTCRVTVCIITLWVHAEWQCASLCVRAEWWCASLHYENMLRNSVYHYIMRTCWERVCIITLCAHVESRCASLHFVHMLRDGVYHYIPSRLNWTNISLPPMLIGQKFYTKCMKSEHAAQKYAGNLHKIWKQLTF